MMDIEYGAPVSGIRMRGVRAPEMKTWGGRTPTGSADAKYRELLGELRGGDTPDLRSRLDAAKSELARAEQRATRPEDRAIVLKARQDLDAIERASEFPAQFTAAVEGARQLAMCRGDLALKAAEAERKATTPEAIQAGHLARVRHEFQTGRAW